MIIDYKNITEEKKMNFKGGNGELDTRDYIDAKNKIMMSRLQPGANTGYHKHEMNSEIVYIISGEGVRCINTHDGLKSGVIMHIKYDAARDIAAVAYGLI